MKKKLTEGQQVWAVPGRYASAHGPHLTTVSKVGNKFFTLASMPSLKFEISTLRSFEETSNYRSFVYLSKQDHDDKIETDSLYAKIRQAFQSYKTPLTLEQLRKINEIINI